MSIYNRTHFLLWMWCIHFCLKIIWSLNVNPTQMCFCHGMVPNCWMVQRYDLYCVVLYLIIVLSWLLFNSKPSFIHILAIFASLHHLKTYYKTSHTMWGNLLATTMTMESQILCFGQGCREIVVCIQNLLVVYTHFTIEHFISNQIFMFAKLILNFHNTKRPSNMY